MTRLAAAALLLASMGCLRADAETAAGLPADTTLVVASDPELRALAAELLPGLSERSGMQLREPVRLERRTRDQLEDYLRVKLDEELPPDHAERLVRSYHLLGLAPADLDLRALLLSVYREQVAGFYDPDSTALFVLDDQDEEALRPLLLHELVHAVQDQSADLDALTSPDLPNDRRKAAQAAIEGHATLVMMEEVIGGMRGEAVDVSEIPDMAGQLRPALASVESQFPALAGAPAVVKESLLFPYLEGASYVLDVWRSGAERGAALDDLLPASTEQVMDPARALGVEPDAPTAVEVVPGAGTVLFDDDLGQAEAGILLREVTGDADLEAGGWDGDRYALVDPGDGSEPGLAWATVWDDHSARDAFVAALRPALGRLPATASLETMEVDGRPLAVLRVALDGPVEVRIVGGGQ